MLEVLLPIIVVDELEELIRDRFQLLALFVVDCHPLKVTRTRKKQNNHSIFFFVIDECPTDERNFETESRRSSPGFPAESLLIIAAVDSDINSIESVRVYFFFL
jgi:hypothetical protein